MNNEKEKEYITVSLENGDLVKYEVITAVADQNDNQFVIYTDNKIDDVGNVNLFTSKIISHDDDSYELVDLSDEEWDSIKEFIDELSSDEVD